MTMNETLKTYVSTGTKVAKGIKMGQYIMRISAGFLLLPKKIIMLSQQFAISKY